MVELNIMVRVRWTAHCQGFSEPNTGPQWCQYEISDCGLRISDCRFRIADFGLQKNFAQFHALTVRRVMNSDEFKKRTKEYGLRIVRFVETLRKRGVAEVLSRQLVKSGTSVGANYRCACRDRSSADFIAMIAI